MVVCVCVFYSMSIESRTVHLNICLYFDRLKRSNRGVFFLSLSQFALHTTHSGTVCSTMMPTRTKCIRNESLCYCLFNGSTHFSYNSSCSSLSFCCQTLFPQNKTNDFHSPVLCMCVWLNVWLLLFVSLSVCLFEFRFYWNISHFNKFVADEWNKSKTWWLFSVYFMCLFKHTFEIFWIVWALFASYWLRKYINID